MTNFSGKITVRKRIESSNVLRKMWSKRIGYTQNIGDPVGIGETKKSIGDTQGTKGIGEALQER